MLGFDPFGLNPFGYPVMPPPGQIGTFVSLSPTQSTVFGALRAWLLSLPLFAQAGQVIEVVQGLPNRVPEPKSADFVVMTVLRRPRLATNIDTYADVSFAGGIAGNVLTVVSVAYGAIVSGSTIFGPGVASGTTVVAGINGAGGIGTYQVSVSQNVASSPKFAAGTELLLQETRVVIQLDVHGPNAHDNSQVITTLFRDDMAVQFFDAYASGIVPLHADDARLVSFDNDQQQVEIRYMIEAHLQVDQVVQVPQQFADQLSISLNPVDVTIPA